MSTGPEEKPVFFLSGEIKTPPFSPEARVEAGMMLRDLQEGETIGMPRSRPMPSIGRGCHELRIRDAEHNWRIFCRIDDDAILILEIIDKKTRTTPKSVIELCKKRLKNRDNR